MAGAGLAVARVEIDISLTRNFIFYIILPPLLFEGALHLHWKDLRQDAALVSALTIPSVVISTIVIAAGMHLIMDWPRSAAVVFGVLVAATDPVAVVAMFKDMRIEGRLRFLIESESLLNDGVAAVFFAIAITWTQTLAGQPMTAANMAWSLIVISGGGIIIGLAIGIAAIVLVDRTSDHLLETAVTTAAAYGSMLIAEHFQLSGVLATVTCGLLIGNVGILFGSLRPRLSPRGREFILAFWEFAAFLANSLVFLMLGLTLAKIPFFRLGWVAISLSIALILVGRAVSV